MPRVVAVGSVPTSRSFRAAKVMGMFDIPAADEQRFTVEADLALDGREWQVGAIVGGSGRGKTMLARQLWPDAYVTGYNDWSGPCILDDFPAHMSPAEVIEALTAVGLSSALAWLRPYRVLSVGQQFRADLAKALTSRSLVVFDEFTSTVDRDVAKAASVAVAKYVRKDPGRQFVAVTCHRDIVPWLSVDWWYDIDAGVFHWGRLQRPPIHLHIRAGVREA